MAVPSTKQDGDVVLGVGISGMRERVRHLGGLFHIASARGLGTTIRVVLPWHEKEAVQ
jgi:signal transduction histidine kinase